MREGGAAPGEHLGLTRLSRHPGWGSPGHATSTDRVCAGGSGSAAGPLRRRRIAGPRAADGAAAARGGTLPREAEPRGTMPQATPASRGPGRPAALTAACRGPMGPGPGGWPTEGPLTSAPVPHADAEARGRSSTAVDGPQIPRGATGSRVGTRAHRPGTRTRALVAAPPGSRRAATPAEHVMRRAYSHAESHPHGAVPRRGRRASWGQSGAPVRALREARTYLWTGCASPSRTHWAQGREARPGPAPPHAAAAPWRSRPVRGGLPCPCAAPALGTPCRGWRRASAHAQAYAVSDYLN